MLRRPRNTVMLIAAVALLTAAPALADDDDRRERDRDRDDRRPRASQRHDRDRHHRDHARDRHHHNRRHNDTSFHLRIDSDRGLSIHARRDSDRKPPRYTHHRYHRNHRDYHRPHHTYRRYHHRPHHSYHYYRPAPKPVVTYHKPVHAYHANGWELLSKNHALSARKAFERELYRHPHNGRAKVGLALANAILCNDGKAAYLMREVLIYDSAALQRAHLSSSLRHKLAKESHRLERKAYSRAGSTDDLVLAASIQFMLGRERAALGLVHRAIESGDNQKSTYALKLLAKRHAGYAYAH